MTVPARPPKTTQPQIKQDDLVTTRTPPKRINVAVTPEAVLALQLVIDTEQVSLTEAVRRLLGYGEFIYRAIKQDGYDVLLNKGDETREVVLLS